MRAVLGAATAAIALACASGAQAAPATLKPTASPDEIEAWTNEHVETGDDVLALVSSLGAELFNPYELEKTGEGHLVGWFRAEFAWPQSSGKAAFRSTRQRVEIDCAANKVKILTREAYAENNLGGRVVAMPTPGGWSSALPEDSGPGREARQACSFAGLVGGPDWAKAMPRPPNSADPAALRLWYGRNVVLGDYLALDYDDQPATFYSPKDLEKLPDGRVRARLRRELLWPVTLETTGVRSTLMLLEVDCARQRSRMLDFVVFPGSNMLGAPYADFEADDSWSLTDAGGQEARHERAICRLADDPKMKPVDALRPPEVPALSDPDEEKIAAWVGEHLNTNGYVVSSFDAETVYLYSDDLALDRTGNILSLLRVESTSGPSSEFGGARSWLMNLEFDCDRRRFRQSGGRFFELNNLEGGSADSRASDWMKAPEDSHIGRALAYVCAQRSLLADGVDQGLAFTPPPADYDDDDMIAQWVAEYVDARDYAYAGYTDEGVGFYSETQGERRSNDHLRVWTRLELFTPELQGDEVVRSVRALTEYDCKEGRSRILATETYPGANLTGEVSKDQASDADWSFIEPNTLDSVFSRRLCTLKEAADSSVSEPRLPNGEAKQPL